MRIYTVYAHYEQTNPSPTLNYFACNLIKIHRTFEAYSVEPGGTLLADLFIDRSASAPPGVTLEFLR